MDLMTLPERKLKIKIINMLMEVEKNIQELRNEFWSEIQSLKHTMDRFKSRLNVVEETVNGTEIREEEYKEAEAQREKGSLRMEEY